MTKIVFRGDLYGKAVKDIMPINKQLAVAHTVSYARPDLTWLQYLKIADAIATEGKVK